MTANVSCDVLIIGSGSSGLIAAIALAERGLRVIVACKDAITESSSTYAQGGIAVALSAFDSVEEHVQDTLRVGCGLCDETVVRDYLGAIRGDITRLSSWGIPFNMTELGLEGAHSHRRILKIGEDLAGRGLMKSLWEISCRNPNLSISQGTMLVDLLEGAGGECTGGIFQDINDNIFGIEAKATIIASGGYSSLYARSTNPTVSTGDGIAVAMRAGAAVRDMEFVQFHPTALAHPSHFLLSETLRGEGAKLINGRGERFMEKYAPDTGLELAQRSVVSKAIWQEIKETGAAYLDMREMRGDCLNGHLRGIAVHCLELGFDIIHELTPITPAAHYTIGGITVDGHCRSSLRGLWVIGEAMSTRLHGSDRLASNSLLECIVSAFRAAEDIGENFAQYQTSPSQPIRIEPAKLTRNEALTEINELKEMMWEHASFNRSHEGLNELTSHLTGMASRLSNSISESHLENLLRNHIDITKEIIKAISSRKEELGVFLSVR